MPKDSTLLHEEAVQLAFMIDDQVHLLLRPANIDLETLTVSETAFAVMKVDFLVDLSIARPEIQGASKLELTLVLNPDYFIGE